MGAGGRREGSGRKPAAPGEKRIGLYISISPNTHRVLQSRATEEGVPVGRIVDKLITPPYEKVGNL